MGITVYKGTDKDMKCRGMQYDLLPGQMSFDEFMEEVLE